MVAAPISWKEAGSLAQNAVAALGDNSDSDSEAGDEVPPLMLNAMPFDSQKPPEEMVAIPGLGMDEPSDPAHDIPGLGTIEPSDAAHDIPGLGDTDRIVPEHEQPQSDENPAQDTAYVDAEVPEEPVGELPPDADDQPRATAPVAEPDVTDFLRETPAVPEPDAQAFPEPGDEEAHVPKEVETAEDFDEVEPTPDEPSMNQDDGYSNSQSSAANDNDESLDPPMFGQENDAPDEPIPDADSDSGPQDSVGDVPPVSGGGEDEPPPNEDVMEAMDSQPDPEPGSGNRYDSPPADPTSGYDANIPEQYDAEPEPDQEDLNSSGEASEEPSFEVEDPVDEPENDDASDDDV